VREQPLGAVDLRGSSEFSSVFSASTTAEALAPMFLPTLQTFASDCTTPKSDFNVGDTVCVKSTSATVGDTLQWGDPCSDAAVRTTTVTSATMTDTFTLPASGQTTGGGACDARGDWKVDEFTSGNAFQAEVRFRVHDPAHAASNLSVVSSGGVTQPNADNAIIYFLTNAGPDDAANAQATFSVPTNMTFGSFTGAAGWTCPASPTNGVITCTRASFPAQALNSSSGDTFTLHATTPASVGASEIFTSVGTVSSSTHELL